MLWGMAAWRSGILRKPEQHKGKLSLALLTATAAAIVGAALPISLAVTYVTGILLLFPIVPSAALRGLAAVGRMALTNYLLQSVILGFIFYGYGLGRFGRIGSASAASVGVALYLAQIISSSLWLRHFRFGPVEWLWRSLTYRRLQPMIGATQ
jgi:uncharacterized protein